ncbi:MAG: phosphate--acyl-ACP acyltransferase, partial [Clostridia bacterium]|nr:phosphate--acyl-ACP acyltransferase [Clostridia bacterium]
ILPLSHPLLLIDSGANISVTDENLEQFAVMGSLFMEKVMKVRSPRVGLLNNGVERTKGSQVHQDTYYRLEENSALNFIGNVESRALPMGVCDVLVTDGFSGNILLKYTEGLCGYMIDQVTQVYSKNLFTKTVSIAAKAELDRLKRRFSSSEYGGAPLLGISAPVIKAHGSSDAIAIKNSVKRAMEYAESGVIRYLSGISPSYTDGDGDID